MDCHRCGGPLVQTGETVPYVGPGPLEVTLAEVRALTCSACGHLFLQLPQRAALDRLIGRLRPTLSETSPATFGFHRGRWQLRSERLLGSGQD